MLKDKKRKAFKKYEKKLKLVKKDIVLTPELMKEIEKDHEENCMQRQTSALTEKFIGVNNYLKKIRKPILFLGLVLKTPFLLSINTELLALGNLLIFTSSLFFLFGIYVYIISHDSEKTVDQKREITNISKGLAKTLRHVSTYYSSAKSNPVFTEIRISPSTHVEAHLLNLIKERKLDNVAAFQIQRILKRSQLNAHSSPYAENLMLSFTKKLANDDAELFKILIQQDESTLSLGEIYDILEKTAK